jgi:hypothetical protein
MLYCIAIDPIYCRQAKILLPKPIATSHIAMTVNQSDIVAIGRNYHKYGLIATIFTMAID